MIIGQFGSFKFGMDSGSAMLFSDLEMSAESETEDKTSNLQKYVAQKNGKPVTITMTVGLYASFGIDVCQTATAMLHSAQRGEESYMYVSGKKLFPFKLMLVAAGISETNISPGGAWVSARVKITLKQSSKEWISETSSGSSSGSSAGSGAGSTQSSNKASAKQLPVIVSLTQTSAKSETIAANTAQSTTNKVTVVSQSTMKTTAEKVNLTLAKAAEKTCASAKKVASTVPSLLKSPVATKVKILSVLGKLKK